VVSESLQALTLDGGLVELLGDSDKRAQEFMLQFEEFEAHNLDAPLAIIGGCRVLSAAAVAWPASVLGGSTAPIATFLLRCCGTMDSDTRRVAWRALTAQCKGAYAAVDDGAGRSQYESLILAYCDGIRGAISGEFTTPAIWHCACALQMVRHAVCGPNGSNGVFNTENPPSDHLAGELHRILGLCTAEVSCSLVPLALLSQWLTVVTGCCLAGSGADGHGGVGGMLALFALRCPPSLLADMPPCMPARVYRERSDANSSPGLDPPMFLTLTLSLTLSLLH